MLKKIVLLFFVLAVTGFVSTGFALECEVSCNSCHCGGHGGSGGDKK